MPWPPRDGSENKKANPDPEPDKPQSIEFTKAGFLVNLSLDGKKTSVSVGLRNCGNVDARRLPKPADAKVAAAHCGDLSYVTAAKPEAAAEFLPERTRRRGLAGNSSTGGERLRDARSNSPALCPIRHGMRSDDHAEQRWGDGSRLCAGGPEKWVRTGRGRGQPRNQGHPQARHRKRGPASARFAHAAALGRIGLHVQ